VNGLPQSVKITLGSTADLNSEIVDGDIKEGDIVILNPPSEFLNNLQPGGGGFMRGQ